jgi:hypothetical protein
MPITIGACAEFECEAIHIPSRQLSAGGRRAQSNRGRNRGGASLAGGKTSRFSIGWPAGGLASLAEGWQERRGAARPRSRRDARPGGTGRARMIGGLRPMIAATVLTLKLFPAPMPAGRIDWRICVRQDNYPQLSQRGRTSCGQHLKRLRSCRHVPRSGEQSHVQSCAIVAADYGRLVCLSAMRRAGAP